MVGSSVLATFTSAAYAVLQALRPLSPPAPPWQPTQRTPITWAWIADQIGCGGRVLVLVDVVELVDVVVTGGASESASNVTPSFFLNGGE
jgi:hypothetical protein